MSGSGGSQSSVQSSNQPQLLTLADWKGVNQSSSRPVIDDQECWWLENLFPVEAGHLRSGWGPSDPIYSVQSGATIRRIFFANIDGQNPLGFMFIDSGGIGLVDQVNLNTGEITGLGQVWNPVAPHYWADLKLWAPNQFGAGPGQTGGVLIGSPRGLYAWDGSVLSAPGQPAPLWLTNNQLTDANGNAYVMPSGLPGIYALEIYKSRLWVMGQTVVAFSAASIAVDFSAAGGGGAFPYHGDQLTVSRTDLHQSGGFLYLFNDSSTDVVSDLSQTTETVTGGSGQSLGKVQTIQVGFQIANNDPQVGQRFFRPVGVWEQSFSLFNGSGIYLMQGSSSAWASEKIINLMATLDPSTFEPTQCPAHIFGKKWMLYLGMFTDIWGLKRSLILVWSGPTENKWVFASQKLNLTNIASYEQNSVITPYGTDGTSLYQLFARPDPTLQKRLVTKLYNTSGLGSELLIIKNFKRLYLEWMDKFTGPGGSGTPGGPGGPGLPPPPDPGGPGVYITGTLTTHGGGIPNGIEEVSFSLDPGGYDIVPCPVYGQGINAGADLLSYSPDFVLARLSFTFDLRTIYGA